MCRCDSDDNKNNEEKEEDEYLEILRCPQWNCVRRRNTREVKLLALDSLDSPFRSNLLPVVRRSVPFHVLFLFGVSSRLEMGTSTVLLG